MAEDGRPAVEAAEAGGLVAKGRSKTGRSIKVERLLQGLGVESTLAGGARLAPVGPLYELGDGRRARLAFYHDDEGRLSVGYAVESEGRWEIEDGEPFSTRSLGYYQRRLRRIGTRAGISNER